jgi:hypothetical protein
MEILYSFLYLWVIFAFLDPDPDPSTQMNAELCGSGSTALLESANFSLFELMYRYKNEAITIKTSKCITGERRFVAIFFTV